MALDDHIEVDNVGEVAIITFTDKKLLDEHNIQVIGKQLFSLVDELGKKNILLNFSNIEYLAAAAMGKLITLNKKVNQVGGKLVLCEIDPAIYEVFKMTKLNKLFKIVGTYQDALEAF